MTRPLPASTELDFPPRARADSAQAVSQPVCLPHADRFFEIRFESIGGLGAHAAGQVLATAAVLRMGLNGAHFSSYGSEKKGSLVRSYVRLGPAERPIRTSAPVETPDAVVVFHAALLRNPATRAGLLRGDAASTLVIRRVGPGVTSMEAFEGPRMVPPRHYFFSPRARSFPPRSPRSRSSRRAFVALSGPHFLALPELTR